MGLDQNTATGINAALADFGLPQVAHAQLPGLVTRLAQLDPSLSNQVGQFHSDIFGSGGTDLGNWLNDATGGFVQQEIDKIGINVALYTSMAVDPSWIGAILESLK